LPSRVIKTDADFDALGHLLAGVKRPFTCEWKAGAHRSLDQNALAHKWAGEFAAQIGDRTAAEVYAEWKLRIGVPILLAENAGFKEFAHKALKHLSYADRLQAIEYVPVTRLMTVPQMRQFMDAVERHAAENGIHLTMPEAA